MAEPPLAPMLPAKALSSLLVADPTVTPGLWDRDDEYRLSTCIGGAADNEDCVEATWSFSNEPGTKGDDEPVGAYCLPEKLRGTGCLVNDSEEGETGVCTGGDDERWGDMLANCA